MDKIAITGVGIKSKQIAGWAAYREQLETGECNEVLQDSLENVLEDNLSKINIRRCDLFTKLILAAVKEIFDTGRYDEILPEKRGAIFNTDFGPVRSVYNFLEPVISKGIFDASPSIFANTVVNAALGKASKEFKLMGSSYMFCGTNPVYYACAELSNQSNELMLAGCVDEGLDICGMIEDDLADCKASEVAAVLALEKYSHSGNAEILGQITGISMVTAVQKSYYDIIPASKIQQLIWKNLESANIEKSQIKAICCMANHAENKVTEREAIERIFGVDNKLTLISNRHRYGECFSTGEIMGIMDGLVFLQTREDDCAVMVNSRNCNTITSLILQK